MTFGPKKLFIDVETRSVVDLKLAGARRYAVDPSTMITTASWKWAGNPTTQDACNISRLEHLGICSMADFEQALRDADHIVAHNISFDANVIFATLGPCGMLLEKLDCTMARAQRMSLPGSLDDLCKALGVEGKSQNGYRLVMATCKPRKDGTFNEDPGIFKDLLAYNIRDVHCLEMVDSMLPTLPESEMEIWRRTWRKNAHGLPIDTELCQRIAAKRHEIELQLSRDLRSLTKGAVGAVTQRAKMLEWLQTQGVNIPNMQRATVESWLDEKTLPYDAWQALTLVYEGGGSAPTKAQTLLDRQVRGSFQDATRYFGARSGRGTSEGVNFFNLARPSGKHDAEQVIERLKREPDTVFTNTELSDVLRGIVVAPKGMLLLDADLANIELRLSLWFAGDQQKLQILRDGGDLYASTAGEAMGIPGLTKHSHPKERQAYKKCFGAETLVLTRRGWVRIIDIKQEDTVWDGVEWVRHRGLLRQGLKETMNLLGVEVTASHYLLSGDHWATAKELACNAAALRLALATALENLPSLATWSGLRVAACSVFSSVVTAARQSMASPKEIFGPAAQLLAAAAPSSSRGAPTPSATATLKSRRTTSWRVVFTRAWRQSTTAVETPATKPSTITAAVASACGLVGLSRRLSATNASRSIPARSFSCATFSRLKGTITRIWNWTVSIIMRGMNRVTFALSRVARTVQTGARSSSCSTRSMEVFDLLNCGPRHRFMILSSGGPLLAHNCVLSGGYQVGEPRLYNAFKSDRDLPYEYRRDLTHAQVGAIHAGYRDTNVPLQMTWKGLDAAAREALRKPNVHIPACAGKLDFFFSADNNILRLRLPSGRTIPHYKPTINENGELVFLRARYGRMLESRAFGGSWLEIACQASARDVLTACEADIERELPDTKLILDIYDSIVALAPEAVARERLKQIEEIMGRPRAWAEGLPLSAEGYVATRMQK